MFEKAVISLDLSPAEQPILDCLPALQHWGVHHMVLTHVIQFGYAYGAALAHQDDYADWLEKCAHPLRAAGISVEVQIRASGVPADEILALASETGADLIVVGSRGQNLLSKLFLGSVAREVIRKTTVPLLLEWIEPSVAATKARCAAVCKDTLRHVLLATDFSKQAAAAENSAIELAPKAQQVDCLHVMAVGDKTATPALPVMAQAALTALAERIEEAGGHARTSLLEGTASTEIAHHAASQGASLIVVGKHGQNWIESAFTGNTAAKLCEIAARPVLIVP